MTKEAIAAAMLEAYDLDLDLDAAFGKGTDQISRTDLEAFLIPQDGDGLIRALSARDLCARVCESCFLC